MIESTPSEPVSFPSAREHVEVASRLRKTEFWLFLAIECLILSFAFNVTAMAAWAVEEPSALVPRVEAGPPVLSAAECTYLDLKTVTTRRGGSVLAEDFRCSNGRWVLVLSYQSTTSALDF